MAKEALEVIDAPEESINIVYERPLFHKRVFANFIDILILFLTFIASFILFSKTLTLTPAYRNADKTVSTTRRESTLYRYSEERHTWETIATWMDNNNEMTYGQRMTTCQLTIDSFHYYLAIKDNPANEAIFEKIADVYYQFKVIDPTVDPEKRYTEADIVSEHYTYVRNKYREMMLDSKMVYKPDDAKGTPIYGLPMFVWNAEHTEVVLNEEITSPSKYKYYYQEFYTDYTLITCPGYLIQYNSAYKNAMKTMSNFLFFIELPCSILLAGFLTYLLPTFFWRREHFTVGKFSMQIGLVDSECLSPSFGRFLARWAIFFFGEVILSFFTFGIPFIISFSMMVFSKNQQGFPDFMLGLNEIDAKKQKIYYTKYEVALEHAKNHKQAISFEMERREHL